MHCSECGAPGSGNFCANCGARLVPGLWTPPAPPADWSREVRYDVLVAHPDVRSLLSQAARRSPLNLSAQQILAIYDSFLAKTAGGMTRSDLATIVTPILTRMGVRNTKQRDEVIAAPAGRAIVAVLCSLAARGNTIRDVHQARDGCAIEAVLLSDVWTWEGSLLVTVAAEGDRSRLDARTCGQMYDWGKSARQLEQLVSDVRSFRSRNFAA